MSGSAIVKISGLRRRLVARRGMTLIELMIVVAIIGILAAIAVSAYGGYIVDARLGDAQTMLADIRAKEESYYNTWGSYLTAPPNPTEIPGDAQLSFTFDDVRTVWQELAVAPSGGTFWQYEVVRYAANESAGGIETTRRIDTTREYFVAVARSNLDSDASTAATAVFIDSQNRTPTVVNKGQ